MFIIDRLEEKFAVLETADKTTFNIPRTLLPPEAREGDVVTLLIQVEQAATVKKKSEADSMLIDFFDQ